MIKSISLNSIRRSVSKARDRSLADVGLAWAWAWELTIISLSVERVR